MTLHFHFSVKLNSYTTTVRCKWYLCRLRWIFASTLRTDLPFSRIISITSHKMKQWKAVYQIQNVKCNTQCVRATLTLVFPHDTSALLLIILLIFCEHKTSNVRQLERWTHHNHIFIQISEYLMHRNLNWITKFVDEMIDETLNIFGFRMLLLSCWNYLSIIQWPRKVKVFQVYFNRRHFRRFRNTNNSFIIRTTHTDDRPLVACTSIRAM